METSFLSIVNDNVRKGIDVLHDEGYLCDVTVVVHKEAFPCHRLLLAATSDFFRCAFSSSWKEGSSQEVEISEDDVTVESFRLLLDILYKGKDVITMETVKDILSMCIFLQVAFLQEYCLEYLNKNLMPDMCLGVWQLAEKYSLQPLAKRAARMASCQFEAVSQSNEFLHIHLSRFLSILSSVDFKAANEDAVLRAIVRWTNHGISERQDYVGVLLPHVRFPDLSNQYLDQVRFLCDDPGWKHSIQGYINEALTYKLVGGQDTDVQRQILARQHKQAPSTLFRPCAVYIGGCSTSAVQPLQQVLSLPLDIKEQTVPYILQELPESCGVHFATCVWKNELYVSGGSMQPSFFAVYRPGEGKWEKLGDLPEGRQGHSMTAVSWKIYVLGGVGRDLNDQGQSECPAFSHISEIHVYDSQTEKKWRLFTHLLTCVRDAAISALGHRIFVLGGQGAKGEAQDTVQCVSTVTGSVYNVGRLPFATWGSQALTKGGHVYVLTPEGKVLLMEEQQQHSDLSEQVLAAGRPAKRFCQYLRASEDSSSVNFKTIGTFLGRRHFGAYVHDNEVIVCGGVSEDRQLLYDVIGVNVSTGATDFKSQTLLNGLAYFNTNVISVPKTYLTKNDVCSQATLRAVIYAKENSSNEIYRSKSISIQGKNWFFYCQRSNIPLDQEYLSVFLNFEGTSLYRSIAIKVQFSCRLTSTESDSPMLTETKVIELSDQHYNNGQGFPSFLKWTEFVKQSSNQRPLLLDVTIAPLSENN